MSIHGVVYMPGSEPRRRPNGHGILEKAHRKAQEELAKDKEIEAEKLDGIVRRTNRELFCLKAVFPFDLFPNKVIIDESKVTFIFRDFFWVERVHSIYIKDISDCIAQQSFFFATLSVVDLGFRDNWVSVSFLKVGEAQRARRIIQGLIVAHKAGLELVHLSQDHLIAKLEELGKASSLEPGK